MNKLSFQDIILKLQNYWSEQGCAILQGYDIEMGAGTFHPATIFRAIGPKPWNVAFVQPCRRPADSRYGEHPNRMQHYYQFQVILKPSPDNIQDLYLNSINMLGIDIKTHDIRFIKDDWESPTLGAAGLGWEVWCNGMEISQFTYMQQIAGIECKPVPGEITYGLERLALYIQGIDEAKDINWNGIEGENKLTYGDIDFAAEKQFSKYNIEYANVERLKIDFVQCQEYAMSLLVLELPLVAYDYCIKASHIFNILDARGVIGVNERTSYIEKVRNIASACVTKWLVIADPNVR